MCAGLVAREGTPKLLDASRSGDPDGSIVKYEWDLDGNGSFERDSGGTPTITRIQRAHGTSRRAHAGCTGARDRRSGRHGVDEVVLRAARAHRQPGMTHGSLNAKSLCCRGCTLGDGVTRWYARDPVVINGITVLPRSGSTVVIDIPESGAPEVKANRALVSAPAKGSTVKLLDGPVGWRVSSSRLWRIRGRRRGATERPARDGDAERAGAVADGSSRLELYVLPKQFGGSMSSDTPVVLRPGAPTASAERSLRSLEREPRADRPPGADRELRRRRPLGDRRQGRPAGSAAVRDLGRRGHPLGGFEYAEAGIDLGSPGVGPFGPVFLKHQLRIEVDREGSECVPNVGKKTYDMEAEIEKAGVHVDLPEEDRYVTIDYGVPTFAVCGGVGLTAGPGAGPRRSASTLGSASPPTPTALT